MQELAEETTEEATAAEKEINVSVDDEPSNLKNKIKKRKGLVTACSIIAGVVLVLIILSVIAGAIRNRNTSGNIYTDVAVERRTITKSITGSSTIEPNDSYNVMTMISGDITADYFKEGDKVKKGDKLYKFDDESAQNNLSNAQNALKKAEQAYVDAVKQKSQTISANSIATQNSQNAITRALNSLSDSQKSYDDQYVKSDISGKVRAVSVKEGDSVTIGTPIAAVYDDTYMKIRLPFNDYDAENVYVGATAEVTVTGSGDTIYGTVTDKSTTSTATEAHTMLVYATVEVINPGALTESDRGSAVVNGVACADSSDFEYKNTQQITAKISGTLRSLSIAEGDSVYTGEQIAYIESTTASTALSNAQTSYDDALLNLQKQVIANDTYSQDSAIKNAQLSVDDAKLNLKKAEDVVKDYVIEAPIDGTVVKKNAKNGDTRDASNNAEALCVIYDLSNLKISIDVDETEIALVKTGLKAKITADAVDGEFEGTVTKVPVDGVNSNGVTIYAIEVELTDYGDLLPGMNVDAEIIVEEAVNALTVPVNSVNRNHMVFVKDDGKVNKDDTAAPADIEVPKGYIAIPVETGLNDMDYIEIKSGLTEDDFVRTRNTERLKAAVSFGDDTIKQTRDSVGGTNESADGI